MTLVNLTTRRPLSRAQELLWTSQRLNPDAPLENMATCSRLAEPVEPQRFIDAFDEVVRACEPLRSIVGEVDGRPVATVLAEPPARTTVISVAETDVDDWTAARIATPLPMDRCGYDSVLLDHGGGAYSWWLNIHHVITDATASAAIFRATAAAYEGRPFDLGSFRDYVRGLEDEAMVSRIERATAYWGSRETPATGRTELYAPVGASGTAADRLPVELSEARREGIDDLLSGPFRSLTPELSRFAALATALSAYLHRLNGQEHLQIGVPVHHRRGDQRELVGMLVELFPLAIDIAPDDSYQSLFDRVLREMLTLMRNALPGASPRQDFDVVLNNIGAVYGPFGDIAAKTRWIHAGHVDPHHSVRMQVYDFTGDGQVELELDLNRSSVPDFVRDRATSHFAAVLDAMIADPAESIGTVPLATPADLADAGVYNDLAGDPPETFTAAPDLVSSGLRDNPGVAIIDLDTTLTGPELDDRIDRVVTWLHGRGLGPGSRIGIQMDRCLDAVVAIHAVLRLGAAFCPIDPCHPEQRRRHIIDDARLDDVLTEPLPTDLEAADPQHRAALRPDDLAYVLYTSGSTGLPKGVPITHGGLADYVAFARDSYLDHTPPVAAFHSSLSFDLTITSLFVPLSAGGRLRVVRPDGLEGLREIADDKTLTWCKATPSHLEILLRMLEPDHQLRTLVVGGERFGNRLARRLTAVLPDLSIFNEYGPTEAVVGCMIHRFDPRVDTGTEVPIGIPAPGVALRIVDQHGHLSPLGCSGELWISRPSMTTGYLHRDDLNATKFIEADATRWYRSGDRVRMTDRETMVYEGRLDEQLKVSGVRLEAGEVEAAIGEITDATRVVVDVWTPDATISQHCARCGIPDNVPGVVFDDEEICSICHDHDRIAPQAEQYFGTLDELDGIVDQARDRAGDYDCLHLLSGGKDSTYTLYQLVARGYRVQSMTLDNGFISESAKNNARRATEHLGVEHEFVTTEAMNEIFRDSLARYSNVCNGCYKTLYTLAVNRADELSIPIIVTGLSRGQFFETRLTPAQFTRNRFDRDAIDDAVLEARKAYHRTTDAVTENLDVSVFETDDIFDRVAFVDFFRYTDVELSEMLRFLDEETAWQRPPDTGRSTNCLINAAGIYVHETERGFHNYALPYSWDVRLGHKTRDAAIEELDDRSDLDEVARDLDTIGYDVAPLQLLTAWYEAEDDTDVDLLRAELARVLPAASIPAAFVRVDEIGLTTNGKVDKSKLPAPDRVHRSGLSYTAPTTEVELVVSEVWESVLSIERVGIDHDFFDLGGTSLLALEMIVEVGDRFDAAVPDSFAFQHRTVRALATALGELFRDAMFGGADLTQSRIEPLDPDAPTPPSAGEEAMWFAHRLDPDNTCYNVRRHYRVPGGVDRERFLSALRDVVARHETLHTTFGPHRRHLTVDDAIEIVDGVVDEAPTPFDLENGPLVRIGFATADDATLIGLELHHISCDAGALDRLWDDIDTLYSGRALPELPIRYGEHAAWQRAHHDDHRGFWAEQRALPMVETRFALEATDDADGYVTRVADVGATELQAIQGVTPFAVALAAFSLALDEVCDPGRREIAITASVRDHRDAEGLVGYFLNPLPIPVQTNPSVSFAANSTVAAQVLGAALPHRALPYSEMVNDARLAGTRHPELRVMLAFEDLAPASLDGVEVSHRILDASSSVNDLTLFVQLRGELVELGVEFRGSTVSAAGARRVLDSVHRHLVEGLARPTEPTALAPAPDLVGGALPTEPRTVLQSIDAMIAEHPTAVAVRCGERSVTYADLDQRVDDIAASLQRAGVGHGDLVAIHLDRRIDAIASMLAAWRAGASYVPIDARYPPARVHLLREQSNPKVVIDDGFLAAVVPAPTFDRATPSASDPAYVIFTSGSTGVPRGVAISHANLAASTEARLVSYPRSPQRYLMVSSVGFDSSVAGIYWTLATGGELVLPTDEQASDVDALLALLDGATHTLLVPSLYEAICSRATTAINSLETVIVAGESCPAELAGRHLGLAPAATLVNEYGPTEATVWVTSTVVDPDDDPVPIGSPIPGATIRVADADGRPRPLGVAGELWVSGDGVAAGYVNDDEATSERFVEVEGRRWYRTGDRVRRTASDALLFLGRADGQLSVRGVRLEPEEVEAAANAHDSIVVSVAGLVRDRFVLVAEADASISTDQLLEHLEQRLPSTHVPRQVVITDELPRTPHGKLDRPAALELGRPVATETSVVDRDDPVAATVVGIWRRVLDDDSVGARSDFFDHGGDSLKAVEVAIELQEHLGIHVDIGAILEHRTPGALATQLHEGTVIASTLVRFRSGDPAAPVTVLFPPGGGELFRYWPLVEQLDAGGDVYGLRFDALGPDGGVIDSGRLTDALLREEFGNRELVLVGWSTGGLYAYEVLQRRLAAATSDPTTVVPRLAMIDTVFPSMIDHIHEPRVAKYRRLISELGPRGVFDALAQAARQRSGRLLTRVEARRDRARGVTESAEAQLLQRMKAVRETAMAYRPTRTEAPVLYIRASNSNRAVTMEPWVDYLPAVDEVVADGDHDGENSVLEPHNVASLAAHLTGLLTDTSRG